MNIEAQIPKGQLEKIKERFSKLTDQLRRTTLLLKKKEKLYFDLEEKFAQVERELELEKEKNSRLEQQFKESMEGTLDVDALKNATVLNAQIATLKKELEDAHQKMGKLKADTALKIKALQEGLQDEMGKAARAKSDVETQLSQLQEERARYCRFQETIDEKDALASKLHLEKEDLKKEIENLKKMLEECQSKIFEINKNLKEEMSAKEIREGKFKEAENLLKSEIDRLDLITKVFDVVVLENALLALKENVEKSVKRPDQKDLKIKLEEVELMKVRIDTFEKMTTDRVSNYYNLTLELESLLKNRLLLE